MNMTVRVLLALMVMFLLSGLTAQLTIDRCKFSRKEHSQMLAFGAAASGFLIWFWFTSNGLAGAFICGALITRLVYSSAAKRVRDR
jgi:hypothetical protein